MGLLSFRSCYRCARRLPLFFSVLILLSVLCMGSVSLETSGVNLSGTPAVYACGETITFQGVTNHAPGTSFLIVVEEGAFLSTEKDSGRISSGTSGAVIVQAGSPPFWSFSFDTVGWSPGKYQFIVEVPKTGTMQSGTFSLIPAEEMPDAPGLTSPVPFPSDTQQPLFPSATAPSPSAVPFSPALCVAGLAVIFLFRAYFL